MKAKARNICHAVLGLVLAWVWPLVAQDTSTATSPSARVFKFTFGTPSSVTRQGFVKVKVGDAFSQEKGFGFESTQGLSAYDRGGSEITLPGDAYTARTYGAHRTTSDVTCSFVEGTGDNAFLVAAPDGQYTVWLVASDAEWDPPLFEVWANEEKKLDVRIPRARFVFMDAFKVRAADGRLRMEFKGPHGWLVNGLVIGKAGPEMERTIEELDRDIFFLTAPELPNWTERKVEPTNPPLDWAAEERETGYLIFPTDYTEGITPTFVPTREAVGRPLTTFATPGEFEPIAFGVAACRDLGEVRVELSDFVADRGGGTISREHVKVGIVRCWPQRAVDRGGKGEYQIVPERIEAPVGRLAHLTSGETRQWWLTVQVPEDASPVWLRATETAA